MTQYVIAICTIWLSLTFLGGCQSPSVCDRNLPPVNDPLSTINKKTFAFNIGLDRVLAEPISDTYRFVIPSEARDGVHKFVKNLSEPHIITNDVLQGNFKQARSDSMRFLFNSTTGIGGLFDPATTMGFEYHEQNFGVTAGVWGIPEGPFIMLPLIGPTTMSGAADIPLRQFTSPLSFLPVLMPFLNDNYIRTSITGAKQVDQASDGRNHMRAIRNSVNPYVFVRSGYRQRQLKLMKRHCIEDSSKPDSDGFDDPTDDNGIELLPLEELE